MPEFKPDEDSNEPLFAEPFTITIPDLDDKPRRFNVRDFGNAPVEDDVDPEARPVSYILETLRMQIAGVPDAEDPKESEREEGELFVELAGAAISENRYKLERLYEMLRWIGETREEAKQGTLSRQVKRPTKAPRRSTRS